MKQSHAVASFALALGLAGCAHNPVPDSYVGPTAEISDSSAPCGSTCVNLFFVSAVNGSRIEDSLDATVGANEGRGFSLRPSIIARRVPAQQATFTIEAHTHNAAPILDLFNRGYELSGQTTFTPLPDKQYIVEGVLGDNYSAVWIADKETGQPVSQKVEARGSAKRPLFKLGILGR